MSWPPHIGDLLPQADDAHGVEKKLAGYSLNLDHPSGGAKAAGFGRVLAITIEDLDYLADSLREGLQDTPVSEVRNRDDGSVLCEVIVPIRGLGGCADRVATVLTSWHIRWEGDPPRLVTAFITTRIGTRWPL
jgi:Domain of unknown function (DUF6883)